jgi:non-specific serine/threonine protein kinase
VARAQDRWQLRIADFGSGRLLQPERLDALAMTRLGFTVSQQVGSHSDTGTPLYLAPELLSGGVPTERSDVYALGLILYQIAVADLSRPLVPGWERDVEDPLLRTDIARATDGDPQQRLSGAAVLGELLRTRAQRQLQRRESELREQELQRLVLAKRRQAARAPWIYASIAVLCVGVAASSLLYWRARRAGLQLAQQNEVVIMLNEFLSKDLIAAANPDKAGRVGVTVAEAATSAAERIDKQFANGPLAVRAALHEAMQQAFGGLSDLPNAVEEGKKALRDYQGLPAEDPAHVASLQLQLASYLAMQSRFEEAGRLVDMTDVTNLTGTTATNAQARRLYVQAVIAVSQLALPEALAKYQAADSFARAHPDVDADLRERILLELGDTYSLTGDHKRGESVLRQLIRDQLAAHGVASLQAEYTRAALAGSLGYQGRYDEAIALLEHACERFNSAYGPDHRRTLKALVQLANVYFQRGDYAKAAVQYATLHERVVRRSGAAQDLAVLMATNEALALMYAGSTARAATIFRNTLDTARTFLPAGAPRIQALQYNLAYCELDLRRDAAGIASLLQDLDPVVLGAAQQAPDWEGRLAYQRGRLALMQGHYDMARTLLGKALDIIAERNPDGSIAPAKIRKLIEQLGQRSAARNTLPG